LKLEFQLKIAQVGGYIEQIEFHVVRDQVKNLKPSLWIKLRKSNIDSIETYHVYRTNNYGVKLGWKRLKKQLDNIEPTV